MLSVSVPSASLSSLSLHQQPAQQPPTTPKRPVPSRPPPSAWQSYSSQNFRPRSKSSSPSTSDSDDDIELRQLAGRITTLRDSLAPPAAKVNDAPRDPHLREVNRLADRVARCPQIVRDMLGEQQAAPSTLVRTKRVHGLMELIAAERDLDTVEKMRALKLPADDDRAAARALFAAGLFEISYARYRALLADAPTVGSPPEASSTTSPSPTVRRRSSADTSGSSSQSHSTAPTSIESSVTFPGSAQPSESEDDGTLDLLAKLAVAALRAGLPSTAARHAAHALSVQPHAVRARLWAAAAALDMGLLADARKHLARLPPDLTDVSLRPRVGATPEGRTFAKGVPEWVRVRMGAERRRLERMDAERADPRPGRVWAFARDAQSGTLATSETHAMALPGMALTARGYETVRPLKRGELLALAPPLACAGAFSPGVEELVLARAADGLRAAARANPELARALCWAADRLPRDGDVSRATMALGASDTRAALLALVQTRALRVPKAACGNAGAVAVYFPAVSLAAAPAAEASAIASFSGIALVLRAARDLEQGEIVSLDFSRLGTLERVEKD